MSELFGRRSVLSETSQLTFICSNSTIETLEKCVNDVILVFLLLTLNIFRIFSRCFYF